MDTKQAANHPKCSCVGTDFLIDLPQVDCKESDEVAKASNQTTKNGLPDVMLQIIPLVFVL